MYLNALFNPVVYPFFVYTYLFVNFKIMLWFPITFIIYQKKP